MLDIFKGAAATLVAWVLTFWYLSTHLPDFALIAALPCVAFALPLILPNARWVFGNGAFTAAIIIFVVSNTDGSVGGALVLANSILVAIAAPAGIGARYAIRALRVAPEGYECSATSQAGIAADYDQKRRADGVRGSRVARFLLRVRHVFGTGERAPDRRRPAVLHSGRVRQHVSNSDDPARFAGLLHDERLPATFDTRREEWSRARSVSLVVSEECLRG